MLSSVVADVFPSTSVSPVSPFFRSFLKDEDRLMLWLDSMVFCGDDDAVAILWYDNVFCFKMSVWNRLYIIIILACICNLSPFALGARSSVFFCKKRHKKIERKEFSGGSWFQSLRSKSTCHAITFRPIIREL